MVTTRQPQGIPVGGQYAPASHPEGDAALEEGAGTSDGTITPVDPPVDPPKAKVHGEISAYAARRSVNARTVEQKAQEDAERFEFESQAAAAKAEALRKKAAEQHLIGRWNSRRKAKKSDAAATELDTERQARLAAAKEAADEAGRMEAGVKAERKVVATLMRTEGVRHVLCGLNLGPGIGDIDAIAVGDHVVVVEVKAGRGALETGADGTIFHGGRPTPNKPIEQCAKQVAALREHAGVEALGVVCFPDAEPFSKRHKVTGCHLIGGTEALTDIVSQAMRESESGPCNAKAIVTNIQASLSARFTETEEWIQGACERRDYYARKIAHYEDITRQAFNGNWSNKYEVRRDMSAKISEKRQKYGKQVESINRWTDWNQAVNEAYWSNARKILEQ